MRKFVIVATRFVSVVDYSIDDVMGGVSEELRAVLTLALILGHRCLFLRRLRWLNRWIRFLLLFRRRGCVIGAFLRGLVLRWFLWPSV